MEPLEEFFAPLSDEALTDLGHEATTRARETIFLALVGLTDKETVHIHIDAAQAIFEEMRRRTMKVEAHNLWDRLNESVEGGFFGGLTYTEMYPEE